MIVYNYTDISVYNYIDISVYSYTDISVYNYTMYRTDIYIYIINVYIYLINEYDIVLCNMHNGDTVSNAFIVQSHKVEKVY